MKKTILFLAAGVMMLSATSCTKDYTCTCTFSGFGVTYTEVRDMEKTNRASANAGCPERITQTIDGDTFTGTCEVDD